MDARGYELEANRAVVQASNEDDRECRPCAAHWQVCWQAVGVMKEDKKMLWVYVPQASFQAHRANLLRGQGVDRLCLQSFHVYVISTSLTVPAGIGEPYLNSDLNTFLPAGKIVTIVGSAINPYCKIVKRSNPSCGSKGAQSALLVSIIFQEMIDFHCQFLATKS